MRKLKGMRVAVLAADGFEQAELTRPVKRLEHEGARVTIVSLHKGRIRGMNLLVPGRKVRVDATLRDVKAADFDALLLPGGFMNPDFLRQSALALDFVKDADLLDMPIAVICHGPWLLASAGLLEGRHVTSWPGIRNDMENAGAHWTDEPVVRDGNWVSSRGPHDLLAFEHALVELFAERMSPAITHRETAAPGWPRWVAGGLAAAATLGLVARGRKALA